MTSSRFSADHNGFYRDEKPFFPKIQSDTTVVHPWSNGVLLRLEAGLKSDLDWGVEKKVAEKFLHADKELLWELDFQLQLQGLSHWNTSAFFANMRAVEAFVEQCSPFFDRTIGVCIYRGNLDLLAPSWQERFLPWVHELALSANEGHELKELFENMHKIDTPCGAHYYRLFCASVLAEYLHRLVAFLPDTLLAFGFLDAQGIHSCASEAQLFSKERFKHLHLGICRNHYLTLEKGAVPYGWIGAEDGLFMSNQKPSLGIYLPKDTHCDRRVLHILDCAIAKFRRSDLPFRLICEENLHEEWDGLDRLYVIEEAVSTLGRRKLQGFCAAGGEIISLTYSQATF